MFKKILRSFICLLLVVIFGYLLIPAPSELPPLYNSLKSTEPGDTVQIPGISAYYTNLSRKEVVEFYEKNYSKSSFLNIPLLTYRLNHPPEIVKDLIVRNTQQSSYLEEVVHPLRESLFVSGFEWENDPFTKPEKRIKNKLIVNGKEYITKVTIFQRNSSPFVRVLTFGMIVLMTIWLIKETKAIMKDLKNNILPKSKKK